MGAGPFPAVLLLHGSEGAWSALSDRNAALRLPDAVAAHNPPDVVCGAFQAARWRNRGDPGWQAWDPADL